MKPPLDRTMVARRLLVSAWLVVCVALSQASGLERAAEERTQESGGTVLESADRPGREERSGLERGRPREIVQVGGIVEVREEEEARDVVVVFGELNVRGTVRGNVVVVFGRATIEGAVGGNVVTPFSRLRLGSDARVSGDLVVVLGELQAAPTATIGGQRIDLSMTLLEERLPGLAGFKEWLIQGLLWARPLPHQSGWWWWVALGTVAFYFLTALIFGRPLAASVTALERCPAASFFVGLLVLLLAGPLLLMLVATGVGLIVVPFVVGALLVACLFGKIAVYQCVGRELGRQVGLTVFRIPLVALLIGLVVVYAVYMVPVLGLLVWSVTALLGVGGVWIALFAAFRVETVGPSAGAPALEAAGDSSSRAAPADGRASTTGGDTGVEGEAPGKGLEAMSEAAEPPRIPGQVPVVEGIDMGSLPRVGFWLRFWATLIDLLLIGVLVGLLQRGSWFIAIWAVYHVGMWAWRGTTIGGIVMGLKIGRVDGRPIDFPIALVRGLSSFLSALALFVGFFWAGWTREKRAWHDIIAGTMIVRVPKGMTLV